MKSIDPLAISGALMKQIGKGAFLTAKAGEALNTMTIGWGMFGFIWQRRVFVVPVRNSRHTFSIMEKAVDFTVTVPTSSLMHPDFSSSPIIRLAAPPVTSIR